MQEKYYRNDFSEKAYVDINYAHPSKPWDEEYQEKCHEYPIVEHRIITKAIRVRVEPEDEGAQPKEYLVWSELETRRSDLGNKDHVVRTNLGIYLLLTPTYKWKWEEGIRLKNMMVSH